MPLLDKFHVVFFIIVGKHQIWLSFMMWYLGMEWSIFIPANDWNERSQAASSTLWRPVFLPSRPSSNPERHISKATAS